MRISEADRMFLETDFVNKEEIFEKGELIRVKYRDEYERYEINFNVFSKEVRINGVLNLKELHAVNTKVKELGWL